MALPAPPPLSIPALVGLKWMVMRAGYLGLQAPNPCIWGGLNHSADGGNLFSQNAGLASQAPLAARLAAASVLILSVPSWCPRLSHRP